MFADFVHNGGSRSLTEAVIIDDGVETWAAVASDLRLKTSKTYCSEIDAGLSARSWQSILARLRSRRHVCCLVGCSVGCGTELVWRV